jgi:tetratricopeptide (TPR) repeat protein
MAAPFFTGLVAVVGLAFADGGYRPSEWGLAIVFFVVVGVSALVVFDPPWPPRIERAFLAGLVAFTFWTTLSTSWSPGAGAPVLEAERSLVYVAAVAAVLLVLSTRRSACALTGGVLAGAVVVSLYGLGTRLFPGRLGGTYDASSGLQLDAPIGYSNALAVLATLGIVLSLGVAAHGRSALARALAAAALVLLGTTLYLTFSRGALVALAAGLLLQAAVDPRRGRLVAAALAPAALAALGALLASRSRALVVPGATLEQAQEAGWQLASALVVLALVAAACAPLARSLDRRLRPGPRAGRAVAIALLVGLVAAVAAVIGAAGGPVELARQTADAFADTQPTPPGDEGERVLNVSGSGRADYWRVAWEMSRDQPLVGSGAGSYEAHWLRDRPPSYAFDVRDAHNLYLETLAELGLVGLALLVVTLAVPLAGLARARRRRLAPAAGGAYVAFLAHAAVDWDWEIPAVTVAGLLCGAALLASSRALAEREAVTGGRRLALLAFALPLVAVALVAHVGNRAIAASETALLSGEPVRAAAEARRARAWAPWSHEPWQRLGEAELALGHDREARTSLRRALELDPENWRSWYALALASRGEERARAHARVKLLNPLSPEADNIPTDR